MNTSALDFLKRHPNYAFRTISGFYPLNGELLRKFRNVLFWDHICENEEMDWSSGRIQTFLKYFKDKKGKLNSILHYNTRVSWSVEFIKRFEPLWYWDILGEKAEIQNNGLIQDAFKKQLEPVNTWIASIHERFSDSRKETPNLDNSYLIQPQQWTLEEIEMQKDKIDWYEISIDGRLCDWNLEFLLSYEKYIDFDALIGNQKAWVECFGKLSDSEIEDILGSKEVQAKVDYSGEIIEMDEIERSHFEIPKCLTYEYFVKNKWLKEI